MKYFVSIENTAYFRWQAELLIQSYKRHSLENDLVVAVADSKYTGSGYTDNLNALPGVFSHPNYGLEHGHPAMNKLYGLTVAVEKGLLGDTYTVLHPDMVLYKPVVSDPNLHVGITHHQDDRPMDDTLRLLAHQWPQRLFWLGSAMTFTRVPPQVLMMTLGAMHTLNDTYPEWKMLERAAWGIGTDHKNFRLHPAELEMSLLHFNPDAPIIHYRHGMPPLFHKRQYGDIILNEIEDPMDAFNTHASPASEYVASLAEECQRKRAG
jgi:hypothetical protein